jgi:hypothetical protein
MVTTSKNALLRLLIVAELERTNVTLKPFFKNPTDHLDTLGEILGVPVKLDEVKAKLLNEVLAKLWLLKISQHLSTARFIGFSKDGDDFVFSFDLFKLGHNEEQFVMTVQIRFKRDGAGKISAYKKFEYDGPSGRMFEQEISEMNSAFTPGACVDLIAQLLDLKS